MKKLFLLALLIGAFFFGCGTRKRNKTETETAVKKLEQIDIKKDCTAVIDVNIDIHERHEGWTAKPVDNSKPMILDGKKYENAILSNEKKETDTKYKKKEKVNNKQQKKVKKKEDEIKKEFDLKVERDGSNVVLIYYLAIAVVLYLIYRFIVNKKNPLQ